MRAPRRGLEIPCREIVELITDYLDNALVDDERRAFEEHLADCPPCARYLDQIRTTITVLGTLPADALSEQAWVELQVAFRVGA